MDQTFASSGPVRPTGRLAAQQFAMLALCLAGCPGCFLLATVGGTLTTEYMPAQVRVIDGETGLPIAGARVHAPITGAYTFDKGSSATADDEGLARLRVARYVSGLWAEAPGYMPNPYRASDRGRDQSLDATIALYRPPAPLAGLLLPADFRGIVRVREGRYYEEVKDESVLRPPVPPPWTPGRREFLTRVDPNVVNELRAPPLLTGQPLPVEVHVVRFEDGAPLRFENPIFYVNDDRYLRVSDRDRFPPRPDGLALFLLGREVDLPLERGHWYSWHSVYFVGTREQAAAMQEALTRAAVPAPTPEPLGEPWAIGPTGVFTFHALPLDPPPISRR